ncbi:hypothetical protein APTSU1_001562100 [Apodemus speciosus]|uniref:Uncharacterized protein n=1 Tax=Apodemus speciosus TaxID=105296 RepID=A0ABQ0FMA8_APOSI
MRAQWTEGDRRLKIPMTSELLLNSLLGFLAHTAEAQAEAARY